MADQHTTTPARRQEQQMGRRGRSGISPFGALQRFTEEVERMFEDFGFGRGWMGRGGWQDMGAAAWAPDVDVYQKDDQLTIKADVPGLSKNDITVDITDDMVTIQGERKREYEEEHEGMIRRERSYGSFRRAVQLPPGAITEQAKATFRDGVLEITMPAPPASKGRRIEISDAGTK